MLRLLGQGAEQGTGGGSAPAVVTPPAKTTQVARLIAIVEDEPNIAATYRDIFEYERGWRTELLADGQEALDRIRRICPDGILLDLGLPGLDGKSLFHLLQGRDATGNIPILIVTGSREWEIQRLGLAHCRVLYKPCDLQELLATMDELLAETAAPPAPPTPPHA
ncbi:MAG TPA: response regulator [Ktedonobacterales bacterium]